MKFLFCILLLLSLVACNDTPLTLTECSQISLVQAEHRCDFARIHCAGQSMILNYAELHYCQLRNTPVLYYSILVCMLLMFFYMMYTTSDSYLCMALQAIAGYCKMSPQVAGLTFLAFGNGAPDFFTALAGTAEKPVLILGGSIGSGLFITAFVFGSVIYFSKTEVAPPVQVDSQKPMVKSGYRRKMFANYLKVRNPALHRASFLKNSVLYLLCVLSLLVISILRTFPLWLAITYIVVYVLHLLSAFYMENEEKKRSANEIAMNALDDVEPNNQEHENDTVSDSNEKIEALSTATTDTTEAVTFKQVFDRMFGSFVASPWYWKIASIITFPIDLLCFLSIPPMIDHEEQVSQVDLFIYRVRLFFNPWFSFLLVAFVCFGLNTTTSSGFPVWAIYMILALALSIIVLLTSNFSKIPKYEKLVVIYAFAVCILWIYFISNEVIAVLSMLGTHLEVSDAILGLTLLAWGNSFGDFVADLSVSKAGGYEVALTAVFCGPIQNVLMTLGISFLKEIIKDGSLDFGKDTLVDSYIGLGFLIFGLFVTVFATSFGFNYKIPRYFGLAMIVWYFVYVAVGLSYGLAFATKQ